MVNRSRRKVRKGRAARRPSTSRTPVTRAPVEESQEWYRLIVNNVRDFAIFTADIDGRIRTWNPGAERFFGYGAKEIVGKPMDTLYAPEDRARGVATRERAEAAEQGTSEDERWHVRKDGSRFFVFGRVNPMYTDQGQLCGFIKIARDITERKDLQSRLDSSEELHKLILENIQDFAIFTTNPAGTIETWNTGAENTYGYNKSEIIGQNISLLYTPEERARGQPEKIRAAALTNAHAVEEHWCVRKDGTRIFVTGVLRPIRDDTGSIRGFSKVARDITARRQLQEKLEVSRRELEQLVAKRTASLTEAVHELETFSYSLSHDMRAPLRAMQGFAEVILAQYAAHLPDQPKDLLRRIVCSAERLDHLIKESLAYHRTPREPLPLQAIELEPLLETLSAERPGLAIDDTLHLERPLMKVMAHGPSLAQALANLLDNALRFVPAGSKPHIRLWTKQVGEQIRICVQDNGIGIAAEDQQKVWNLFTRLHPEKFEGSGMGLALVRKAVERMGGTVGVDSKEGKGSQFWVQLAAPQTE